MKYPLSIISLVQKKYGRLRPEWNDNVPLSEKSTEDLWRLSGLAEGLRYFHTKNALITGQLALVFTVFTGIASTGSQGWTQAITLGIGVIISMCFVAATFVILIEIVVFNRVEYDRIMKIIKDRERAGA